MSEHETEYEKGYNAGYSQATDDKAEEIRRPQVNLEAGRLAFETLAEERDHLKAELKQAQANGAELFEHLKDSQNCLQFDVSPINKSVFEAVVAANDTILNDDNPGQALLDLIASLRGLAAPQGHEKCTDCGRAMVWQRTGAGYPGAWMCPNCVLYRLEKLERVRTYARHKGNCEFLEPIGLCRMYDSQRRYKPCSCGLDEALVASKEG